MIWVSNILALGVPDEGYYINASCALNLISTLLFWNNLHQVRSKSKDWKAK